jgi:3-oxoacyl-[acyl-carrier protein] reductase
MSELSSQVAVVTGAGRGIGRAIALKFASEGADVVCVSRTAENAEKVAGEVRSMGRRAWARAVDVSHGAEVGTAAEAILSETGRVDILVNNAGVTRDGLLMRMNEEDWDTVLDTNLRSFPFTRAFGPSKQRSGRIINVASVIGLIGNAGQTNYAASKAALIGFTKSLAREWPRVILSPWIYRDGRLRLGRTNQERHAGRIPLNYFGQPETSRLHSSS